MTSVELQPPDVGLTTARRSRVTLSPWVWVISGVIVAFHLATAQIYTYHGEELYQHVRGQRLDWGFPENPPLIPALYWLSDHVFGWSLLGVQVIPALVHGGVIVLTGLLARELGGDRRAQVIAALGATVCPILLDTGHFLTSVTVEVLAWLALSLIVVRLLNGGDPRLWLVAGAVVGVGLLARTTTVFVVAGVGFALTVLPERRVLAVRWVLAGAALALALWAPFLIWQANHGWPQIDYAATFSDYDQWWQVVPYQFIVIGATSVLLALPGLLWLLRDPTARPYRAIGIAYLAILLLVAASGGQAYFAAVFAPPLLAAGAVSGGWPTGRMLPALVVATGLVTAPLTIPLLPLSTADTTSKFNTEIGEMVGWPEFVSTVAQVYEDHPDATVLTFNYSEAAAIETLGSAHGLPQPISGHMSYWYWGHPAGRSETTIAVGYPRDDIDAAFDRCELATTFRAPEGVQNAEDGAPIWVCTEQREDWATLWPTLQHFTTDFRNLY